MPLIPAPAYAELQVTTNFSFLRGASHPEELVRRAAGLGHAALGIADRNSLAGVVRAHEEAKALGLRLVVGARLDLLDGIGPGDNAAKVGGASLLCFPEDRAAYGRLCRLLTIGKRRAPKGQCHLREADLLAQGEGQLLIALPPAGPDAVEPGADFEARLRRWREAFGDRLSLAASHLYRGDDARRLHALAAMAERTGVPLVATNDVHHHAPGRRRLQDVLSCIREGCTLATAGARLHANAERHLKRPAEMARLFARLPEALARSVEIAGRARFSLDELRYEYPDETAPDGRPPQEELERLTWLGATERYGEEIPEKVRAQLAHEFGLIAELGYAPYFLTVHDIVRFARARGILCQGRGSAANSAVCYCLGITAVDPGRLDLLFERFISAERNEPPDIDVDFEHERREEVIQYVYQKYGRHRAGLAATVIRYRARSAIREVGKALGLSLDTVGKLAGTVWGWSSEAVNEAHMREVGLDPRDPTLALAMALAREIIGFPRHLSQHVGGFVITKGPLSEVVPICNAAMADRTNVEWDKDDLDALGILKIDVLGLGMLTCIRKGFELIARHHRKRFDLATVPAEDPAVYDMLCQADSIGVFQVESRAQMSFLPRMKPRDFYDLVIEVAIVRPGPIQGDMVHPYLRRRNGEETVDFPSDELRQVLGKTLGIPLFQEQAMRIAVVAAGFTPGEADRLRRAMATFRKTGQIHSFREKMVEGMVGRGYQRDFAERCFSQIEGFGEYGFPESHAASFALLVYVSAWMKRHYPAIFACALLNSQPMGFYAPAQIVRDARDHGVELRPVDVNRSEWDNTLEPAGAAGQMQASSPSLSPLTLSLSKGEEGTMPASQHPTPHPPAPGGTDPSLSLWEREEDKAEEPSPIGKGWRGAAEPGEGSGLAEEEPAAPGRVALRLGFRQIKGFREEDAAAIVNGRGEKGYPDPAVLWRRTGLGPAVLERLARADGFGSMDLDRRAALWAVRGLGPEPLPLFRGEMAAEAGPEPEVVLPEMALGEQIVNDYASLRLSLRAHPLALLRPALAEQRIVPAAALRDLPDGRRVTVAGLVLVRQRPGSAKGVIFATLEDETGLANCIVWPPVFERHRREVLGATLLAVTGPIQKDGMVIHVVARELRDLSGYLGLLEVDPASGSAHKPPKAFSKRLQRQDAWLTAAEERAAARALAGARMPVDEVARSPGASPRPNGR